MKFGNLVEICVWPHLAVKGLRWPLVEVRLYIYFIERKLLSVDFKEKKTLISHHTRVRGNEDLPLLGAPALRPLCCNVHEIIKSGITRGKYAHTKE